MKRLIVSTGYALALLLTGVLTPHFGWRGAFLVNAASPFVGTVIAWLALKDTRNVVHGTASARSPFAPLRWKRRAWAPC